MLWDLSATTYALKFCVDQKYAKQLTLVVNVQLVLIASIFIKLFKYL